MGLINILPTEISNKIAAGEVVERPASVVKELVENAIDAGSTLISVELKKGGITYIRVSDNGKGMSREDAEIAFLRHATSKINSAGDLDAIYTLGFRGEALSSIGAVSKTELYTKRREDEVGTHVTCQGGIIESCAEEGMPDGTVFEVCNLFYNTPARMNFLRRDVSEAAAVTDIMERFILSHPEISFRYISDGKEKYFTPGDNNPISAFYAVYGKSYVKSVIPVDYETEMLKISGLIGKGDAARPNRTYQSFFVNRRYVRSLRLSNTAEAAYKNQIMVNKHPMLVLNIEINPALTNVNVHPTKLEVKFSNEDEVYRALFTAIENALYAIPNIPQIERREKPAPSAEFVRDKSSVAKQENIFTENTKPKETPLPEKPTVTVVSAEQNAAEIPKEQKTAAAQDYMSLLYGEDYNKPSKSYELNSDKEYFMYRRAELVDKDESELKPCTPTEMVAEPDDHLYADLLTSKLPAFAPEEIPAGTDNLEIDRTALRVIGQLFGTYILAESGNTFILADQHAAHERLKYEELKKSMAEHRVNSQLLLVPFAVSVTAAEHAVFIENAQHFADMGFEIEDFGENALIVRATPETLDEDELKQLVLEIIDKLAGGGKGYVTEKLERALYTIACKAAVKANRRYDTKQLEALLNAVLDLGNINTCPHGRPIIVTMSKKELEKEFKRIV